MWLLFPKKGVETGLFKVSLEGRVNDPPNTIAGKSI
jgi:hypothetical protein